MASRQVPELVRRSTLEDLRSLAGIDHPIKYRRAAAQRVYCNRDVNMEHIAYIGFDMDYTLAAYRRPAFDELQFSLICETLVKEFGYPSVLQEWHFQPDFLIRGLLLDTSRGNFIKCDAYGVMLRVLHGRRRLLQEEMEAAYPSGNVASSQVGEEFQSMDTLYHLPIANVYANLVHYFDDGHVERDEDVSAHAAATTARANGIAAAPLMADDARISYLNLWQDVRAASDMVHERGLLKQRTLERLTEYLSDDDATYRMLRLLRGAGKRLFLLTNSEYWYTSAVMDYMVGRFACPGDPSAGWRHAFDVCIVGAKKPAFFRNGTTLREVDVRTGRPKLDDVRTRHLRLEALRGRVFQGGSIAIFHALAGVARGSSVLYVGDHVYADVLLARKAHHWRTLLVVPELSAEIRALTQAQALLERLQTLEYLRAEMFRGLDASARERPDRDGVLQAELERVREGIEAAFNRYAGGLFRSAHRTTLFAQQVSFFADLYTERCANLADYPGFYYFSSASTPQMPHEDQPAMTSERVG